LRVALLCPYSLSVPGGVQGQVVGIARQLVTSGHEVSVLAPLDTRNASAGGFVGLSETSHLEIVDLGRSLGIRANGSIAPVALGPKASVRALRTLRGGGFDVLHIHEPLAPGASYACLVSGRTPMVGTFHRDGGSALYTLLRPLVRALADRLDIRCAVSDQACATAQKALGGTYRLIGNGVDVARFKEAEPWKTDGPTVIFVGRHERRKGLEVLLEAFSGVEVPGAVCWVVGEGPDTPSLKSQFPSSSSMVWLGRIGDDELAMRLRGSDVACFPSLGGESFGVVLLEAMAARAAILASDIPAYRSVAGDQARLVRPGDVSGFRSGLEDLLSDASRGAKTASPEALDAGSSIAETFSMSRTAESYVTAYEDAVAASGGR
jgi:phosphatidylinositol alpha-mannosyltransferase